MQSLSQHKLPFATHACEDKAPKVQMPRCSSMYASMQLADAYDSTYACSRSMEASKQYHGT